MLDPRLLRERTDIVINDLKKRGDKEKEKWVKEYLKLDEEKRRIMHKIQQDRAARNRISLEIARMRKEGKNPEFNQERSAELGQRIKQNEEKLLKIDEKHRYYLMRFPNILHKSVPEGKGEEDNKQLRTWGHKPKIPRPKSHTELLESLDMADIERAGKIAGSRFYFLKNEGTLLDMALQQYAMGVLVREGYIPVLPPNMMRRAPYEGVTDLGDFEDVMYKIEGEDLYLIATSEHPMASMYMNEIVPADSLPIRMAGVSPCYRKEAGSHGKDTKGIFRVHQFNKIEQFVLTEPDDSWRELERLIEIAEKIFQGLELPYRVVNVCTGDMGTVAAKKYDLEVWMPVQGRYREAASCSNCTEYQSRRLMIRYGNEGEKPSGYVHTLNCTAVATTRAIVAIMENNQQKDGSVLIPKVLQPYLGGLKKIEPK